MHRSTARLRATLGVLVAAAMVAPAAVGQPAPAPAPSAPAPSAPAPAAEAEAPRDARRAGKPRPSATEAEARAARGKASELLKRVAAEPPGTGRYKLVDAIIELGDAAWPLVEAELPRLVALAEGEGVVVDLLLGFLPISYARSTELLPTLSDESAWRIVRFVLRLPEDAAQTALLLRALPRQDERILLAVIPPLVARGDAAALPRIVELVDDPRPPIVAFAVDVIAAQRHAPALSALVRLFGIESRRASATNLPLRIKLIHAIARIGGEAAVAALLEGIGAPDQRRAIIEGLQTIGPASVKSALFLLRTASGTRLLVALEVLAALRMEAATELVALLQANDAGTRELAIDVLAFLGVADVRADVVRFVQSRPPGELGPMLRLCAALYGDEVRALFFQLLESPNPEVRRAVVETLWRLADPKTFGVLRLIAAQDRDNAVRIAAIHAVAGVDDPKGLLLLRKMVQVPHHDLKMALVTAIGQHDRWQTGVPALLPLLGDPDDAVFRAALAAMERLTLHQGPRRMAQWQGWLAAETARKPEDFEALVPAERRFVVEDRELSVLTAGEGPAIVVVAGPPFRDATHLAPWVWQLAGDFEVSVMRRAPWPYRASREAAAARWDREVDAMLTRVGRKSVILLSDLSGSLHALRYAAARPDRVVKVILVGGTWPTLEAVDALPGEILAAVPEAAQVDVDWGLAAGWRTAAAVARRVTLRGLLPGMLATPGVARRMTLDNLADDAFSPLLLQRMREEAANFDPAQAPQPVLLLVGDKAPWAASGRKALAAANLGKRVQWVVIPGAGAAPLAEAAKPTLAAIEDFAGR